MSHEQEISANNELELEDHEIELTRDELMKGVWGDNFASPIKQELTSKKDFKVLELGFGSGAWISQLSKDYPLTKFIGLGVSPRFYKESESLQNNLQFIQGDILEGLPFENDFFDFVHMRVLMSFTEKQWEDQVVKELIRVCKPGGWIELLDIDVDGKSMGPCSNRLLTSIMSYLEFNGINGLISEEIPDLLEATNQVDTVHTEEKFSPIGNWGGDIGKLALKSFTSIFRKLKELPKFIGIDEEEYEIMINRYAKEVDNYRSYFITIRFYCQKNTS